MPEARSYWDLRQIDSKEFVWMVALSMVFCFIWVTTGAYFRTLAVLDTYVSMTLLTTELTNWDVCWWWNPIERDQVQTEPTPEWSYQNTHYNYLVWFPDWKFVTKIWHDVHERFVSASSLKLDTGGKFWGENTILFGLGPWDILRNVQMSNTGLKILRLCTRRFHMPVIKSHCGARIDAKVGRKKNW